MSVSALYIGSLYKLQPSPKKPETPAHASFLMQRWDVMKSYVASTTLQKGGGKRKRAEFSKDRL